MKVVQKVVGEGVVSELPGQNRSSTHSSIIYGYIGNVGNLGPALPFLVSIPFFQQTAFKGI